MTEVILVTEAVGKGKDGLPCREKPKEVPVYAKEKSVARSEFYESMRAGVTPRASFEVRQEDFEMSGIQTGKGTAYATKLVCGGITYRIQRAYRKGKSTVELTCV